jgi:excinuclease ABC subunit C
VRGPGRAAAYAEQVDDVVMFLEGRDRELVGRLRERMATRAAAEDFEVAAQLRDSIVAVEKTVSRQTIVQDDFVDQDVFGLHREGDAAELTVLFVRAGKLVGKRSVGHKDQEAPDAELLAAFVQQYYASGTYIPDEVVVPVPLDDAVVLAEWLTAARGKRVRLLWPQRGTRTRLVELADKNAAAAMARDATRAPTPRPPSTSCASVWACAGSRGASSASTSPTSRAPRPWRRW